MELEREESIEEVFWKLQNTDFALIRCVQSKYRQMHTQSEKRE
jgi:hypothetical protein